VAFQTIRCPNRKCGKRVDVRLDLASIGQPRGPIVTTGKLLLDDGREVRYRLPSWGDEADLDGLAAEARTDVLLDRCLDRKRSKASGARPAPSFSAKVRSLMASKILAEVPRFDTTLELQCVECHAGFPWAYSPVEALLGELRARRSSVLREIHHLAFHYHWSQSEILSLPQSLRHEHFSVLDQELARQPAPLSPRTHEERDVDHG